MLFVLALQIVSIYIYDGINYNDVIFTAVSLESVKDEHFTDVENIIIILLSNMSRPETFGMAIIVCRYYCCISLLVPHCQYV